MNGTGYARVDIRINEKGEIYILEINPNCSVYYSEAEAGSADFILLQKNNGHQKFTDILLKIAMNRVVN
jgi:D-alanine-D-alanine ligase